MNLLHEVATHFTSLTFLLFDAFLFLLLFLVLLSLLFPNSHGSQLRTDSYNLVTMATAKLLAL